ncbi:MAG: hypothetical protein WEB06_15375 [Actinomycetota bacterium]
MIDEHGSQPDLHPVEPAASRHADKTRRDDIPTGGRLLLGWVLVLASVILLALGWFGVSGNPQVAVQLAYLASGGLGGLLAGIIGSALLLSNDIRRDRERLGRVEGAVLELREMLVAQSDVLRDMRVHPNGSDPARAGEEAGELEQAPDLSGR